LNIRNEDVSAVVVEIPEGHRHLRTTIRLQGGEEITFQEATVANLVRAFITVKTHPWKRRVALRGQAVEQRKDDYAEWQLLEEEPGGEG